MGEGAPHSNITGRTLLSYFNGSGGKSRIGCKMATRVIHSWAVLDYVNSFDEYDAIFPPKPVPTIKRTMTLSEAKVGDVTWFEGDPNVARRNVNWIGENVIKLGNDRYYGFGTDHTIHSREGWIDELWQATKHWLNDPNIPRSAVRESSNSEATNRTIEFIDVADVGMRVFDHRIRAKAAKRSGNAR